MTYTIYNATTDREITIMLKSITALTVEKVQYPRNTYQLRIDCRGGKSYYCGLMSKSEASDLRDKVLKELSN